MTISEHQFLERAIELSCEGMRSGIGGPFGCVIVKDGKILVLNLPSDYNPRKNDYFTLILEKPHGNAKLLFYRRG